MGVVGSISIKDNVTAVLRGIREEQSSFKQSVADTKKELKSTWEKQYKARLDAAPATKKITELRGKLAPLSKKLAIAIAVKDLAMEGLKRIGSKVKEVGKMVAKPVVNVAVKGAKALATVGKGVAEAAKVAAIGIGAIGAAGAAALKGIYNGSADAARAQIEAETKLEAVLGNVPDIAARGAGAARQAKDELITATDVPDYWWDGKQKQKLETQKVDLTTYDQRISELYGNISSHNHDGRYLPPVWENYTATIYTNNFQGSIYVYKRNGGYKQILIQGSLLANLAADTGGRYIANLPDGAKPDIHIVFPGITKNGKTIWIHIIENGEIYIENYSLNAALLEKNDHFEITNVYY